MKAPYHVSEFHWSEAIRDLSQVAQSTTRVRLVSGAKNFHLLQHFSDLEALWCFDIDSKKLELISNLRSIRYLFVETVRAEGALSLLANLGNLEVLKIDSCSRKRSLAWVEGLRPLAGLGITNFKNVSDIAPISAQEQLLSLSVAGGIWSKMTIDSLEPLRQLRSLQYLDLTSLRVIDESLEPLGELQQLRELSIANSYPFEEFARLSRRLPSCDCSWFNPYQRLTTVPCKKCKQNLLVMLSGKRMPTLCSACDESRLKKHEEKFYSARDAD